MLTIGNFFKTNPTIDLRFKKITVVFLYSKSQKNKQHHIILYAEINATIDIENKVNIVARNELGWQQENSWNLLIYITLNMKLA